MKNMKNGWFVGNFDPSFYKTSNFEVGVHFYKKDQKHDVHYHAKSKEINYLLSGKMKLQDKILQSGDLFSLEPFEVADPIFLEDCTVVIVKVPSLPGDKYKAESPK